MSKDKLMSTLKQIRTFISTVNEKLIEITTKTTDFVAPLYYRSVSFMTRVHDKTVDFFVTAKYEGKSFIYNQYDRVRSYISLNMSDKQKSDVIEYRGVAAPTFGERAKSFVASKANAIQSKLPSSGTEFKEVLVKNHKTSKRSRRRIFLNAKEAGISSFHMTREYIQGIRKSTIAGLSAIAVGGFMLTFMLTSIVSSYAMGVTINGETVGFVENEEEFATLVEGVKQELSEENYNTNIEIDDQAVQLDSMAKSKDKVEMLDEAQLKEKLMTTDAVAASGAAITLDGQPLVYVASTDDAYGVLKAIRQKYDVAGEDVFAGFKENIGVSATEVDVNNITPTDTAITFLLTGNEKIEQYTTKEDDTLWDIAVANGLTEKELKAANPGVKATKIKEGDVINISKLVPYVHMEVVATVNVTEKINYKTKKVESSDLYVGESEVRSEGKRGEKSVVKRAVYVNGKEAHADVISETVVSQPKDRVVVVGTKEKPVVNTYSGNSYSSSSRSSSSPYKSSNGSYDSRNKGTLGNPMRNMILSSPFGYRGGRFHSGDDYRNPAGTAIYAAAGGKVTYSGYDGAYGNTVRISHGNGMVTVYAHCKNLNVRSGATVSKGQQIATVGRTGRATGNHLHFEVRINGSAKNPRNYL